jgi:NADH dehydrogenase FAD-containing subunit
MNIVVVGGGFGGVKAALELAKRHVGKITLISDEPYFLHHATLYATATGRSEAESVLPLKNIFMNYPSVTVIEDKISSIDADRRLVIGKTKQYHYDEVIFALGSVTTYFNVNGMAKHAYGIKSLQEVREFQDHIHDEVVQQHLDQEYFIIGAGPTGVELAGALCEYLRYLLKVNRITHSKATVTLVEAAPRILPKSSTTASKIVKRRLRSMGIRVLTNRNVEGLDKDMITIEGKKIPTHTAVWTSGVANNPFFAKHPTLFHLAPNGRVNVNPYLEAAPHVYVIGDNNTVKYSGLAWPAMHQGTYVAQHLSRLRTRRPTAHFRPRSVMSGVPVGEGWGYVEWLGLYVAGRPGFWIRRWMELYGYTQVMPLSKAVRIWRSHDIHEI